MKLIQQELSAEEMMFNMRATIIVILLTLSSNAFAWGVGPFAKAPYDKASHALGGMAIRAAIGNDHPVIGALAAFGVGYLKELSDQHFDQEDLGAWVSGVKIELKF